MANRHITSQEGPLRMLLQAPPTIQCKVICNSGCRRCCLPPAPSEVFTLPLVFRLDSDQTAWTPRTVLGLSSDHFWLRGLLNIQCKSKPVQTESKQSPLDYSESSDSLQESDLAADEDSSDSTRSLT
jgi:hypothetical protein